MLARCEINSRNRERRDEDLVQRNRNMKQKLETKRGKKIIKRALALQEVEDQKIPFLLQ